MADAEDTIIEGVIWINQERVSGAPCFLGTRVPVKVLFDYLEAGYSSDRFLEGFPGVTEAQVRKVISLAEAQVQALADAA